jgi:hypothetical protein
MLADNMLVDNIPEVERRRKPAGSHPGPGSRASRKAPGTAAGSGGLRTPASHEELSAWGLDKASAKYGNDWFTGL